jgi:hypothetical protein
MALMVISITTRSFFSATLHCIHSSEVLIIEMGAVGFREGKASEFERRASDAPLIIFLFEDESDHSRD